ncbi:hypothetical protein [Chengkuizengella marina]|uniref:Uncharacterized protein n=1 Tax=Chengkuizengella marina TaxID=2507566 RepID=A0A6N9Q2U3_9BACL|nr:hypothetical protein [Chengkuizengella marina]NBI29117.1 hypothetical protein [Chengkuizengella marina]
MNRVKTVTFKVLITITLFAMVSIHVAVPEEDFSSSNPIFENFDSTFEKSKTPILLSESGDTGW